MHDPVIDMCDSGFVEYRDEGIGLTRDELRALWEDEDYDDVRDDFLAQLATLDDRHIHRMYDDDYIYEWCEASEIMDRRISALLDELKATALHCPAVGNAPTVFVITIHPGFCDFDG